MISTKCKRWRGHKFGRWEEHTGPHKKDALDKVYADIWQVRQCEICGYREWQSTMMIRIFE